MRSTLLALVLFGCGSSPTSPPADGGTSTPIDAAAPPIDTGTPGHDADVTNDAGGDAAVLDEVCTGGLDEDGDGAIDCADSDCFEYVDCIAADVAHTMTGLTACGDPIELDATATHMACTTLGTPSMQTTPTDCTTGSMTATARVFCSADGHAAALWIVERVTAPEMQEMLDARHFRLTYYERESVLDWERQESGPSAREGGSGFPIHEAQGNVSGGTLFRVITVRSVLGGDRISRLGGFAQITSLIDLDASMSMDSRSSVRLGGLTIDVPRT